MITSYQNIKFIIFPIYLIIVLFTTSSVVVQCSDGSDLEVQQNFPFEVNVMPFPKEISNSETVEIRIKLLKTGSYLHSKYFIRYFQFEGEGTLKYYDEPIYKPNDLYELPKDEFRLYYTSKSMVSQSFDVWISDSFDNERKISFQFNNKD